MYIDFNLLHIQIVSSRRWMRATTKIPRNINYRIIIPLLCCISLLLYFRSSIFHAICLSSQSSRLNNKQSLSFQQGPCTHTTHYLSSSLSSLPRFLLSDFAGIESLKAKKNTWLNENADFPNYIYIIILSWLMIMFTSCCAPLSSDWIMLNYT